jgi:hypothetical protein
LKDGLARCIDWSMGVVTQGSDKYRLAEKYVVLNMVIILVNKNLIYSDKLNKLDYVYGSHINQQVLG